MSRPAWRADDLSVKPLSRSHRLRRCIPPTSVVLTTALLVASVVVSADVADAAPPTRGNDAEPTYLGSMSEARARGLSVREVGIEPVRSVDLRPVDQAVADRSPLDGGLRTVEFGLQMPSGYRQVFSRPGGGFMRADGGLVATFPQSIYVATRQGMLPDIPASTVFVIGGVPMGAEPGHGRILPLNPLDLGQGPPPPGVDPGAPESSRAATAPIATPLGRLTRFGYGPGYRMPAKADGSRRSAASARAGGGSEADPGSCRFLDDEGYRRDQLQRIAEAVIRRSSAASTKATRGPGRPRSGSDPDPPA
ncbi:MAG: hypothetical protein ACYSUU_10020 [Planctomycetota bacterium]